MKTVATKAPVLAGVFVATWLKTNLKIPTSLTG
jgi:hypothetical protein